VRVSFAGATFTEAALDGVPDRYYPDARPWGFSIGWSPTRALFAASFGPANAKSFGVGTYSCADQDATISESTARRASDCTVIIDKIVPGPSSGYVRAYGRFEATNGLTSSVRGTFLGDFEIYE
jgi:hypothetical protein